MCALTMCLLQCFFWPKFFPQMRQLNGWSLKGSSRQLLSTILPEDKQGFYSFWLNSFITWFKQFFIDANGSHWQSGFHLFTFSDRHYDFLWDGLLMSLHSWESCCKCDTALPDLHCEQSWCVFYMWFSLEKSGHTNHNRSDLQQLEFGLPHLKVNRSKLGPSFRFTSFDKYCDSP